MKQNYWVGGFVTVVILFLNSPGFTQQTENDSNQGGVNESQPNYVIGLRRNAAPISSITDDIDDNRDNFKGYCYAFIETLKTKIYGNIKTVSVSRGKRFAGLGDKGEKLDALCGPQTMTTGRETRELQENGLDGKFSNPFAWTSIAVVLKKKDKDIFSRQTPRQGLKIGVLNGTTTKEAVKALYPSLVKKIKYYNNFEETIEKLKNGEITAYFDDEILLKGRLEKNLYTNSNKEPEYEISPIPSVIEYGIVVFHTKENKNNKLLQAINNLLEKVPPQQVGSITIKILENNQNYRDFINSVEQNKVEDSSRKPNPSPPVSPSPNLNWLLVFPISIIIIGSIILVYFYTRAKKSKLVSPISSPINIGDTLDLYHNRDVDPRAMASAYKQLAANNPEAQLEIVAMEKLDSDKFLLRAKTTPDADKSKLNQEYFDSYNHNYDHIKGLPEKAFFALLIEKDRVIFRLENIVEKATLLPTTDIKKVDNINQTQGGISQIVSGGQMDGGIQAVQGNQNQQNMKNKTSNFDLQNAQFAGGLVDAETVTANQIGGNITNYTPQPRQTLAEAAAEIQQLLKQLEETNPTETETVIAAKAADEIKNNPTLKTRVLGALKSGGKEAFKEAVDNPLVNILIAIIEGWQEAQ